jgi:hypothetical protein
MQGIFIYRKHTHASIHTSINHCYIISESCLKITVALVFFSHVFSNYLNRPTGLYFLSFQLVASAL